MLQAVLEGKFVDTQNVAYDYDVTNQFTWNFKELVEIKKRLRKVRRFYRASASVLLKQRSLAKWNDLKAKGRTANNKQVVQDYKLYEFYQDKEFNFSGDQVPNEKGVVVDKRLSAHDIEQQERQYKAYVTNGGRNSI